jgi:hypothetical protein
MRCTSTLAWALGCLIIGTAAAQPEASGRDLDAAVQQIRRGDYGDALIRLHSIIRGLADAGRSRDLARAYTWASVAYLHLEQRSTAESRFREALKIDPNLETSAADFTAEEIGFFTSVQASAPAAPPATRLTAAPTPAATTSPPESKPTVETDKKGSSKSVLVLLGAGAVAGVGAALALSGGSDGAQPAAAPAPTPTPTPAPRSDTFAFTLPAGSRAGVTVGPVRAGNGPLEVTLSFSGDFIILACVGSPAACMPMGGRPMTRTFNIPADFPAGPIQAGVYFNPNFNQPPGDATGTVRFVYNPL